MAKKKTIHLKNVKRELKRAAKDLETQQKKAEPAARKQLDLKIKKVNKLMAAVDAACGATPGDPAVPAFGGTN